MKINRQKKIGFLNKLKLNLYHNFVLVPKRFIVVIGGANLDIIGNSYNLNKGESSLGSVKLTTGGAAKNIAENLGKLGVYTLFVSAVGTDDFGDLLIDSLNEVKVNTSKILRVNNKTTGNFMAILDNDREVLYAINDMEITSLINRAWIERCSGEIKKAEVVVVDLNLRNEALDEIFNISNSKIFVDLVAPAKAKNILPYLNRVWALFLTPDEAKALVGVTVNDVDSGLECVNYLNSKGVKNICLKINKNTFLASDGFRVKKFSFPNYMTINLLGARNAMVATWSCLTYEGRDVFSSVKAALISYMNNAKSMDIVEKSLDRAFLAELEERVDIEEQEIFKL